MVKYELSPRYLSIYTPIIQHVVRSRINKSTWFNLSWPRWFKDRDDKRERKRGTNKRHWRGMLQDLCRRMGTMYTERTKESSSRNTFAEAIYLAIGLFPALIIGPQAGNTKSLVHMHRAFALYRWFTPSCTASTTRIVRFPSKKQSINFRLEKKTREKGNSLVKIVVRRYPRVVNAFASH